MFGDRSLLSVIWLFLSLTGGTRFAQTPPVGQKKQDDTRQSSNGPRTRTPQTPVITAWKANLDLENRNTMKQRFSDFFFFSFL